MKDEQRSYMYITLDLAEFQVITFSKNISKT